MTRLPAIFEWPEERLPLPPLLPTGAGVRAHVRALAAIVWRHPPGERTSAGVGFSPTTAWKCISD
jgi:hypothetical protein